MKLPVSGEPLVQSTRIAAIRATPCQAFPGLRVLSDADEKGPSGATRGNLTFRLFSYTPAREVLRKSYRETLRDGVVGTVKPTTLRSPTLVSMLAR